MTHTASEPQQRSLRMFALYGRELLHQYVALVTSSALAALAAFIANGFDVRIPGWLYLVVFGGVCFLWAGFGAWKKQYLLAIPAGPRLSLRFDPNDPYCVGSQGSSEILRVQVLNEGSARAKCVRVILGDVSPRLEPQLLRRCFRPPNATVDTFDVSPMGGLPGAYVDVLEQWSHAARGYVQRLALKGAQQFFPEGTTQITLDLLLDAEVLASPFRLTFVADERGRMRPLK